jgi:YHS domain-containing protein
MRSTYFALALIIIMTAAACNSNTATTSNKTDSTATTATADTQSANTAAAEAADSIRHADLNKLTIANTNDPNCDMPLARGFDDTATYNGKLIGFCSKECKDEFLKNPAAHKIKYK